MTYNEFLKELKAFRGKFFMEGRSIRQKDYMRGYCPVAAVSMACGGGNTHHVDFLPERLINKIIDAADGEVKKASRRQTRKDLIRVLGLKEV